MGTFFAGTQQLPPPEQNFDLRNPLGVTPAALLAIGAAAEVVWAAPPRQPDRDGARPQDVQQPPAAAAGQQRQLGGVAKQQAPAEMFRQFEHSRRELRAETVARLVTPSGGRLRAAAWVDASEVASTDLHAMRSSSHQPAANTPRCERLAPRDGTRSATVETRLLPSLLVLQLWTSDASAPSRPTRAAAAACPFGGRCPLPATPRWETVWRAGWTHPLRLASSRTQVRQVALPPSYSALCVCLL